jgi:hypothetical protein
MPWLSIGFIVFLKHQKNNKKALSFHFCSVLKKKLFKYVESLLVYNFYCSNFVANLLHVKSIKNLFGLNLSLISMLLFFGFHVSVQASVVDELDVLYTAESAQSSISSGNPNKDFDFKDFKAEEIELEEETTDTHSSDAHAESIYISTTLSYKVPALLEKQPNILFTRRLSLHILHQVFLI